MAFELINGKVMKPLRSRSYFEGLAYGNFSKALMSLFYKILELINLEPSDELIWIPEYCPYMEIS